ncbi:MAG: hypothetical protein H8F28_01545 [Fibrella sp.]|nr:hypothetical protein [Armatimonadota bacterium]
MYARSSFGGIFGLPRESPLTMGIIFTVAGLYLAMLAKVPVLEWLAFSANRFPLFFWTPISWPIAPEGGSPLNLLFSLGWFYLFAGSIERAWGTRDFGTVLLTVSVSMAMFCWLGDLVAGTSGMLAGLSAITGPLMVAWAIINRREVVTFFFLPIPAPIIGWVGVAMTWYYGGGGFEGLFLLPVCAAMYWYVTQGRYASTGYDTNKRFLRLADDDDTPVFSRGNATRRSLDESDPRPFNIVRWWRDRQEKKRLEEIFRRSGFTDEDEK